MKRLIYGTVITVVVVLATTTFVNTSPEAAPCSDVEGLAEPSTEPEIEALVEKAAAFWAGLSEEQREQVGFCLDDEELYSWSNLPPRLSPRGALEFGELSEVQHEALDAVFDAFLSVPGYSKMQFIVHDLETHLSTMDPEMWHTDQYTVALFGTPGVDGSWGVQLDGHHIALNFLVHGDEVSIVPAFMGAEPMELDGVRVLGTEEDLGYALVDALNDDQREQAILSTDPLRDIVTSPGGRTATDGARDFDYTWFDGEGLQASDMTEAQQDELRQLIGTYVYNLDSPFADAWMRDIEAVFDNTYFVWSGSTEPGNRAYYRIYNPAVLIEFDHTLRGGPETKHIHTIVRAPNGKDYGIFAANGPATLREHYLTAAHHHGRE